MNVAEESQVDKLKRSWETMMKNKYTEDERKVFSRIIREFNELYYNVHQQTWCATTWRGVTVYKPPTYMWNYQEMITHLKPDLIIETGTGRGGSALFMADVMELEDIDGVIATIDIDQKKVNEKVYGHKNILMIEGSSVCSDTIENLTNRIFHDSLEKVMVILDSDHEEEHVLRELELYAPLVSVGMPLIVEDTNNHPGPKAAVDKWFPSHMNEFHHDYMCEKFMLTFHRDGYFERIA